MRDSKVEGKAATMVVTTMRGGCRRKGNGMVVKSWMVVSETGESRVEDIDKHSIMQRTGLPTRDLRALDPKLSNPSSILGREKAIVVNLEHIQAIITSNEVLMINSTNPFFLRFLQDLQARVPHSNNIQISNNVDSDYEAKHLFDDSPNNASEAGSPNSIAGVVSAPKHLPFEFKALEACIESTCTCLESEVCDINVLYETVELWVHILYICLLIMRSMICAVFILYQTQGLEKEAYPALDELTSRISTLNLERVRQIKNRLVSLFGRVQKVNIYSKLKYIL